MRLEARILGVVILALLVAASEGHQRSAPAPQWTNTDFSGKAL
jgi:hypothetical protein